MIISVQEYPPPCQLGQTGFVRENFDGLISIINKLKDNFSGSLDHPVLLLWNGRFPNEEKPNLSTDIVHEGGRLVLQLFWCNCLIVRRIVGA